MKIILSTNCISLTGMLRSELGYFIQRRKSGFFSQRSKHGAPPDGHTKLTYNARDILNLKTTFGL